MKRLMHKKRYKKIICMLLTALMLLSMTVACDETLGSSEDEDEDSSRGKPKDSITVMLEIVTDTSTPESDTVPDTTTSVQSYPPEPKPIIYDGAQFNILSAGHKAYNDFESTDLSTVLGQAIYNRTKTVEEKYDIRISHIRNEYPSLSSHDAYNMIMNQVIAESNDYQIGMIGAYDTAMLAKGYMLQDINSFGYINTRQPWWDQNAVEELTVEKQLFYASGSITTSQTESAYVMLYNKSIAQDKLPQGTDLYSTVKEGKWTLDKLAEYSRLIGEDLDGDGAIGINDRTGIYIWDESVAGMLAATGTKVMTVSGDTLLLSLYNDASSQMFEDFKRIAYDQSYAHIYNKYINKYMNFDVVQAFSDGGALFWATSNEDIRSLSDSTSAIGILPYPKLTDDQNEYYSSLSPRKAQFFCIPEVSYNDEMIGVITEALAYYGMRDVWPAYYKELSWPFDDDGTIASLEIIYSSLSYDMGLYHKIGNYYDSLVGSIRTSTTITLEELYTPSKSQAESQITDLIKNFKRY